MAGVEGQGLSRAALGLSEGAASTIRCAIMSTPQDSPRRRKQKARRTKQLAEWREKQAASGAKKEAPAKAKKTAAKK